jgi:predicted secreted Zn-dependent protease
MSTRFPETEWTTYDVDAESLAEAASALMRLPEAAATEWFPHFTSTTAGGRLAQVDVEVPTRVTMPRWTGYARASAAEREEWDRFCLALRAHEQRHLDLVREHLKDAAAQLVGLTPARAAVTWTRVLDALEAASRALDRSSDHGRAAGTILDVAVPSPAR